MPAAHVEAALERANRLAKQARDTYMQSPAEESTQVVFALVAAVEGLHDALVTVCNFYNSQNLVMHEAILALEAQQAAFQEEVK